MPRDEARAYLLYNAAEACLVSVTMSKWSFVVVQSCETQTFIQIRISLSLSLSPSRPHDAIRRIHRCRVRASNQRHCKWSQTHVAASDVVEFPRKKQIISPELLWSVNTLNNEWRCQNFVSIATRRQGYNVISDVSATGESGREERQIEYVKVSPNNK